MKTLSTQTQHKLNLNKPATNLLNVIRAKLDAANREDVIKSMGYNSLKKGLFTMDKFLEFTDIDAWLKSGHYDFNYTAKEFLKKLTSVLEVDSKLYKKEIDNNERIKNEHNKIKGCYIFVNTNFHRTTQPIFALAFMEGYRLLIPAKKLMMFKTKKQILKNISKMVRKHYRTNDGTLAIWGKIDNYIYHHFDGKKYIFDSNGHQLKNINEVFESRAALSLK